MQLFFFFIYVEAYPRRQTSPFGEKWFTWGVFCAAQARRVANKPVTRSPIPPHLQYFVIWYLADDHDHCGGCYQVEKKRGSLGPPSHRTFIILYCHKKRYDNCADNCEEGKRELPVPLPCYKYCYPNGLGNLMLLKIRRKMSHISMILGGF